MHEQVTDDEGAERASGVHCLTPLVPSPVMTKFQASRLAAIEALEAWQSTPVVGFDDEELAEVIRSAEAEAEERLDCIQLEVCALGLAVKENDRLLSRNDELIAENARRLRTLRGLLA